MTDTNFTFADLVPAKVTINLRGRDVEVKGIPFPECVALLGRFPALVGLFLGEKNLEALIVEIPEAVAALVCAGMGRPKDDALAMSYLTELVAGEQIELLDAVLATSMPGGVGPFVKLAGRFGLDRLAPVTARKSAPPSARSPKGTATATPMQ